MNAPSANLPGSSPAEPGAGLNPWVRRGVTLLLIVHLTAVIVPPLAVQPSSMLAGHFWQALQPYIEFAFLDHGYRFFAPEPGPSHLIRYVLEMPDGTTREGEFPNLREEWPRLLYHRHFMLSEFVNSLSSYRPEVEAHYARSYAAHLLGRHGARQATLYLRRHQIPEPRQIAEGLSITDPSLYQERELGTYWTSRGPLASSTAGAAR